ncbi:FecR family protein [Pedobacter frigoris]|uniref:FecR family protein n=1 Tax=Pedobacter frigoris TaxID=2571272 RepID=A0A4U1CF52_9SPHI|nr:FecR family protein [Pedobacter frigoris]TKC04213.1 FecR family protein [Pedobacter frigoris]
MNIDQSRIKSLFQKHLQGTASPEEIRELFDQIGQEKSDEEILSSLDSELMETDPLNPYEKERWDAVFVKVKDDVSAIEEEVPVRRRKFGYGKVGIAAAVATIIISAGIWFLKNPAKENPDQQSAYMNDVAPGKQGATLTLANGKKIRLTDAANGELAKEAGVIITKTANGQLIYEIKNENTVSDKINILTTDNGETYQVRLPDGSSVWLNAASTLKYPASFAKLKDRRVELSGEGYFEIAKDKAHPFIVKTAGQEVEVLGTHFNINSYNDEPAVATTLLEGSVKVTSGDQKQIIKPGEQAVNNGATIKIAKVNIDNITDWKDGDFNFERADFKSVMRKVSRWYNVEVIYDEGVPNDIESLGWVSREKSLSNVLKAIENSGQVHFKIEGRKLYVSK